MGFLSNTWLGDLISGAVNKVDKHVQTGFDNIEKKIDVLENGYKPNGDKMPVPPIPKSIINPTPINVLNDMVKTVKYKADSDAYLEKKTGIKKSDLL